MVKSHHKLHGGLNLALSIHLETADRLNSASLVVPKLIDKLLDSPSQCVFDLLDSSLGYYMNPLVVFARFASWEK